MRLQVIFGACTFFFLATIFILHYFVVGQGVYGDGIYYYAYTRSLYKDGDIRFQNELGHYYNPINNNAIEERTLGSVPTPTTTGYIPNKYPIGASLAWLPAFIIGNTLTSIGILFHNSLSTIGYSDIYQISIGLENILFVVLGLLFLYEFLRDIFSKKIAVLTTSLILFGTNLFYYGSIDVINSHPFSFFLSSFFIYIWWTSRRKRKIKKWMLLGFLYGLLVMTRTQDGIFIVLIIIEQFIKKQRTLNNVKAYMSFGISAFTAFLPQLLVWKIIYGNFFVSPYLQSGESFRLTRIHLLDLFSNPKIGLIYWLPCIVLACIGLFFWQNKSKTISLYAFGFFFVQLFIISIWSGWNQGESFGIRMIISTYPLISVGIGNLLTKISKKNILLVSITVFVILWNILLVGKFLLYHKGPTFDLGKETHSQSIRRFEQMFHITLPN